MTKLVPWRRWAVGVATLVACGVSPAALGARLGCVGKLRPPQPFRVALWVGGACDEESIEKTAEHFSTFQDSIQIDRFRTPQFRSGELRGYDAVVVPGGYMHQYQSALGEKGATSIREFVRGGGVYLGVCAGAYVCSRGLYTPLFTPVGVWSLDSVGRGIATLELTPDGQALWGDGESAPSLKYVNGPSLVLDPSAVHAKVLATFSAFEPFETSRSGDRPAGPSIGSVAALQCPYGLGSCLLFSPHPELSPGFERLLSEALLQELRKRQ